LEKEAAELEVQLSGGTADSSTLRRAAGTYAALGDSAKAGAALEKLTAQDPSDLAAWQALVSLDWPVSELYILGTKVSRIARKHSQYEVHFRLQIEGEGRLRNASLPLWFQMLAALQHVYCRIWGVLSSALSKFKLKLALWSC
jgi:hypothetical protein